MTVTELEGRFRLFNPKGSPQRTKHPPPPRGAPPDWQGNYSCSPRRKIFIISHEFERQKKTNQSSCLYSSTQRQALHGLQRHFSTDCHAIRPSRSKPEEDQKWAQHEWSEELSSSSSRIGEMRYRLCKLPHDSDRETKIIWLSKRKYPTNISVIHQKISLISR